MKLLFAILLSAFSFTAIAQDNEFTISGKIIDSATGLALNGASVFCVNTTFGTITNSEGLFRLKLPNGGYDLILSYTGYETQQIRIGTNSAGNLDISMKQKDKTLEEVAVVSTGETKDGLAKYGQFFFDNFIGTTPASAKCKIENPESLQFFYSKKRNRLKVKAKEDLIISNEALGYKIKYQLDSFAYDYATEIFVFTGYPFFEELPGSDEQKEIWKTNREKAYKGSRLHFVRSWYDSTLTEEGFSIESVDPASKELKTAKIDNPYDSLIYREIENNDVEIGYQGILRVIYKNVPPEPTYLQQNKIRNSIRAQITHLEMPEGFVIQENGYFYEQNEVVNTGYWAWKKMADMLPYDYSFN